MSNTFSGRESYCEHIFGDPKPYHRMLVCLGIPVRHMDLAFFHRHRHYRLYHSGCTKLVL